MNFLPHNKHIELTQYKKKLLKEQLIGPITMKGAIVFLNGTR